MKRVPVVVEMEQENDRDSLSSALLTLRGYVPRQ